MRNPFGLQPLVWLAVALVGCADFARADHPPVQVVLFTHIEDNTPSGTLGSQQCRQNYITLRGKLLGVGNLMHGSGVAWSLQPDWKLLRATLLYEDATLMQNTNGKNFLRYLKEDLGMVIDAHSHEGGGYNYTDVAHLIDSLGVGSTTVIGGHVWDPDSPNFQEWDRFRAPVSGERYPWASWRGDILMGSGTPNHVNDPVVTGVWRPQDRYHYFTHDDGANIVAVGQYKGTIEEIPEVWALYDNGVVPTEFLLTSSHSIRPSTIQRPDGLAAIQDSVLTPITAWRAAGLVVATDFTTLVQTWLEDFGGAGFLYDAEAPSSVEGATAEPWRLRHPGANPFSSSAQLEFTAPTSARVQLRVLDPAGRTVALLLDRVVDVGEHSIPWRSDRAPNGVYFGRLDVQPTNGSPPLHRSIRLIVVR